MKVAHQQKLVAFRSLPIISNGEVNKKFHFFDKVLVFLGNPNRAETSSFLQKQIMSVSTNKLTLSSTEIRFLYIMWCIAQVFVWRKAFHPAADMDQHQTFTGFHIFRNLQADLFFLFLSEDSSMYSEPSFCKCCCSVKKKHRTCWRWLVSVSFTLEQNSTEVWNNCSLN